MNRHGSQEPTYRRASKYTRTEGEAAAELAEAYGMAPHPWQRMILSDWLAVDDNGKLLHSFCVLEVPRQNGKTGVSDPRETWGLIYRGEQILHTAQEYQTAKKAFDRLRKKFGDRRNDPFAEFPELNALVDHYTVSAGQMVLDLKNGGHIEFRTRGSNSDMGRGGTFDLVVVDEAQSYTEAQDAALSPLNSAAPTGSPQTILMGTPPTPESGDKGVIFARSVRQLIDTNKSNNCLHAWCCEEIGDVTNTDRWYQYNPSLGYQLLFSALEKDAATMADDMFAREHLGYFPRQTQVVNYAIPENVWDACRSTELKPQGKTAYGVKFRPDGTEVSLCGAVIPKDGAARISLIDRRPTGEGTQWLADWLNARYAEASCVVIDGKNGVDVLIEKISGTWKQKGSVIRPSVRDVIASVSTLTDALNEKTVTWYAGQELLRECAISCTKRPISGGWGFGGDDSTPVEACALALWGAKNSKRDPSKKMRIG